MKTAAKQRGFTIVETMIVLAVTGVLFLVAALAVGGKQNEAEFQQAANDTQSSLQQIVSQVGSGDYQNNGNFTCTAGSGPVGPAPDIQPGATGQGQNTDCVLLGKAIQFGLDTGAQGTITTYPVAGLRDNSGLLSNAGPTAIAPGTTTNNTAGYPDESVASTLHYGLTVVCAKYFTSTTIPQPMCTSPGGTSIGTVALLSGLGTYNGAQLLSGSQQIGLYPVSTSAVNSSSASQVDVINRKLASSPLNPVGGVQICLASGTTSQSALISIGSNAGSLSLKTTIKNGSNC